MGARTVLTQIVKDHEHYIRTAGSIKRGKYGDFDYAETELLEHLSCEDIEEPINILDQEWFEKLAWRQARCNWYECGYE